MKLPKSLTTVTPLSKTLAAILFIIFPFIGFYLGKQYERAINPQGINQPSIFQNLFCKKWETVCDPGFEDENRGCAPMKICVDPIPTATQTDTARLEAVCKQKEGEWQEEYKECSSMPSNKGLDSEQCQSLGGEFKECASACRHSKVKNAPCIAACVKTCTFN